jgi:intein/homing endonuclease
LKLPHIRPNDRCVFYGETKVYTSKGYKQIKDVQVGDLVLTHKGRFRKVYNTYNTPRKELLYKIIYSWDGGIPYTNFISVTGEHPFMTQRGWVRAKDLTTKDKLSILSTECKECGKSIPVFRKFCSRACISRNTAKKQWEDPEHRKNISAKSKDQNQLLKIGFLDQKKKL